jgi:uncharacterized protein YcgL (UPF0745 family)
MKCFVYKGIGRADTYLWIPEEGVFDAVPEALMDKLGQVEAVMSFELHPGKKLARARAEDVIAAFAKQSYYLQLPPKHSRQSGALLGYGD